MRTTPANAAAKTIEAMRRGAFTYVQKPVDPEELEVHETSTFKDRVTPSRA